MDRRHHESTPLLSSQNIPDNKNRPKQASTQGPILWDGIFESNDKTKHPTAAAQHNVLSGQHSLNHPAAHSLNQGATVMHEQAK